MYMATELDAGDIIDQVSTPIDPDETVEAVHDRLADLGGQLLVKVVGEIAAGTAKRTPQDHEKATLAPMLSRALSPIDWTRPAKGHPRSGPGSGALARHLHRHPGGGVVKVYAVSETGETTGKGPAPSCRRKSRHRRGLRRWQGDPHYRASGARLPPDGCRRLPPRPPTFL